MTSAADLTFRQLALNADRSKNGSPVGAGWSNYTIKCPACQETFMLTRRVGTQSFVCPSCSHLDPDFVWRLPVPFLWDGPRLEPANWLQASVFGEN